MTTILFITLFMLLLSFFFSGMEIAFLTANRFKIELKTKQGNRSAKILSEFKKKTSEVLITILIGNNLALVVFTMQMDKLTGGWMTETLGIGHDHLAYTLLQSLVATIIILIFAEYIPKAIFRSNSDRLVFPSAYILNFFYILFYVPVQVVNYISKLILLVLFRQQTDDKVVEITRQDLDHFIIEVIEGDSDTVPELDTEMLSNALAFKDTKARDCMIPRTEIEAAPVDTPIEVLINQFIESALSKIIIYGESMDEIKGFVHSNAMFRKPATLAEVLQPVLVVPETMPANMMLKEFTENKKSVAIVVDEYGGTEGMITMEDLVEEVFGEIEDEHDFEEEDVLEDMIKQKNEDGSYLLGARLEIDDINEEFELALPEEEYYTTLGGLVTYYAEAIPEVGEEVVIGQYLITIEQAATNRVIVVRLQENRREL